jgi:uncharacterized membrane protein YeaQ/YmgE (transglycosylase-associated protein family)
MSILSFLLFLLVAAACAWIAEALVPGSIPGGFLVTAVVGVLGAWIGASLFGNFGPVLAGVSLLPAIIGSALLVFLFSLLSRPFYHRV